MKRMAFSVGLGRLAKRMSFLGAVALLFGTSAAVNDCPSQGGGTTVGQGESCLESDVSCDTGLTCMHYYGFAGPAGPEFATCEIPCTKDAQCPDEQVCGNIADGAGQVCIGGGGGGTSVCPDPSEVSYVSQDAEECALIRFHCTADTEPFSDECGCGCAPSDDGSPLR